MVNLGARNKNRAGLSRRSFSYLFALCDFMDIYKEKSPLLYIWSSVKMHIWVYPVGGAICRY